MNFRTLFVVSALMLFAVLPAAAVDYCFSVPKMEMLVKVNNDSSISISYDITFHNLPSGRTIDIVDIGVPHSAYDLKSVRANLDGQPLGDIRPSTVVKPGFEIHLHRVAIPPGRQGTLHVEFTVREMVYQDTTRGDYASLRVTPTWFGEQYLRGTTDLSIAVQLPKSVQPGEVLHQGRNFEAKAATPDGAIVGWRFPAARLTGPHIVALSFPKCDLHHVVRMNAWDFLARWFTDSPGARILLGIVFAVLLGVWFFRISGGTGISVYVVLLITFGVLFVFRPTWHLISLPCIVGLIALTEWLIARNKAHYLPPIAEVEGGGIKRGLTAPEAAVLLELPQPKVLALVIFGMLKKGLLRQVAAEPLRVEVNEPFRFAAQEKKADEEKDRDAFYRQAALKHGVVIHGYEYPFLFLLENNAGKPVHEINFSLPLKKLTEGVAARMKGFDLSDTQEYYRSIVRRATEQAAAVGDIQQRQQTLDRNFEWIFMGENYGPVFDYGRPYRPVWTRGGTTTAPAAPSGPAPSGTPTLTDVAAGFSGWAENTMSKFTSAIMPDSTSSVGGYLDLSKADQATAAFFKALSESSGSGGGWGGGCACACAGCACACACAGGGR